MVLIAFSLQDQVEKYGVYVGIAAFFGLAVLSLLYFAQAREVKRLREWAGRAPERAAELEQAVAEHAEEVRRAPATPAPQPQQALSPSLAVTNGTVKLKPEEVAALAFARAAGVHEPHLPRAHPAPAGAAAVAAPPTEVGAAVATGEPAAAQASNGGNGGGSRTVPAPATPAARRADPPPPPLPPRRAAGTPGRRPPAPPPRRESNMLAVVLTAVVGVIVLAGGVFLLTRGSDDPEQPQRPNVVATATAGASATPAPTQAPAPTKETALIAVYNGTGETGLAAQQSELLQQDGYSKDNLGTDNTPPEQQRQTSAVMYRRGSKAVAGEVAETLGITEIRQFDDATQALIANAPKKWNVVIIVGADKMS
jgi:hypothetical protein